MYIYVGNNTTHSEKRNTRTRVAPSRCIRETGILFISPRGLVHRIHKVITSFQAPSCQCDFVLKHNPLHRCYYCDGCFFCRLTVVTWCRNESLPLWIWVFSVYIIIMRHNNTNHRLWTRRKRVVHIRGASRLRVKIRVSLVEMFITQIMSFDTLSRAVMSLISITWYYYQPFHC